MMAPESTFPPAPPAEKSEPNPSMSSRIFKQKGTVVDLLSVHVHTPAARFGYHKFFGALDSGGSLYTSLPWKNHIFFSPKGTKWNSNYIFFFEMFSRPCVWSRLKKYVAKTQLIVFRSPFSSTDKNDWTRTQVDHTMATLTALSLKLDFHSILAIQEHRFAFSSRSGLWIDRR